MKYIKSIFVWSITTLCLLFFNNPLLAAASFIANQEDYFNTKLEDGKMACDIKQLEKTITQNQNLWSFNQKRNLNILYLLRQMKEEPHEFIITDLADFSEKVGNLKLLLVDGNPFLPHEHNIEQLYAICLKLVQAKIYYKKYCLDGSERTPPLQVTKFRLFTESVHRYFASHPMTLQDIQDYWTFKTNLKKLDPDHDYYYHQGEPPSSRYGVSFPEIPKGVLYNLNNTIKPIIDAVLQAKTTELAALREILIQKINTIQAEFITYKASTGHYKKYNPETIRHFSTYITKLNGCAQEYADLYEKFFTINQECSLYYKTLDQDRPFYLQEDLTEHSKEYTSAIRSLEYNVLNVLKTTYRLISFSYQEILQTIKSEMPNPLTYASMWIINQSIDPITKAIASIKETFTPAILQRCINPIKPLKYIDNLDENKFVNKVDQSSTIEFYKSFNLQQVDENIKYIYQTVCMERIKNTLPQDKTTSTFTINNASGQMLIYMAKQQAALNWLIITKALENPNAAEWQALYKITKLIPTIETRFPKSSAESQQAWQTRIHNMINLNTLTLNDDETLLLPYLVTNIENSNLNKSYEQIYVNNRTDWTNFFIALKTNSTIQEMGCTRSIPTDTDGYKKIFWIMYMVQEIINKLYQNDSLPQTEYLKSKLESYFSTIYIKRLNLFNTTYSRSEPSRWINKTIELVKLLDPSFTFNTSDTKDESKSDSSRNSSSRASGGASGRSSTTKTVDPEDPKHPKNILARKITEIFIRDLNKQVDSYFLAQDSKDVRGRSSTIPAQTACNSLISYQDEAYELITKAIQASTITSQADFLSILPHYIQFTQKMLVYISYFLNEITDKTSKDSLKNKILTEKYIFYSSFELLTKTATPQITKEADAFISNILEQNTVYVETLLFNIGLKGNKEYSARNIQSAYHPNYKTSEYHIDDLNKIVKELHIAIDTEEISKYLNIEFIQQLITKYGNNTERADDIFTNGTSRSLEKVAQTLLPSMKAPFTYSALITNLFNHYSIPVTKNEPAFASEDLTALAKKLELPINIDNLYKAKLLEKIFQAIQPYKRLLKEWLAKNNLPKTPICTNIHTINTIQAIMERKKAAVAQVLEAYKGSDKLIPARQTLANNILQELTQSYGDISKELTDTDVALLTLYPTYITEYITPSLNNVYNMIIGIADPAKTNNKPNPALSIELAQKALACIATLDSNPTIITPVPEGIKTKIQAKLNELQGTVTPQPDTKTAPPAGPAAKPKLDEESQPVEEKYKEEIDYISNILHDSKRIFADYLTEYKSTMKSQIPTLEGRVGFARKSITQLEQVYNAVIEYINERSAFKAYLEGKTIDAVYPYTQDYLSVNIKNIQTMITNIKNPDKYRQTLTDPAEIESLNKKIKDLPTKFSTCIALLNSNPTLIPPIPAELISPSTP